MLFATAEVPGEAVGLVSHEFARRIGVSRTAGPGLLAAIAIPALLAAQTLAAETRPPVLDVGQMTFVASRGSVSEVVLRAVKARVDTAVDVVHLETVWVSVSDGKSERDVEITCERGELDLTTSDFRAEGNVKGRTESGLEFSADWVRYDHERGLLFTDTPVLITDETGTFRGGGFQYIVDEKRFKLLGGASAVKQN
jgi:LPS export ABC transporter protein LptC